MPFETPGTNPRLVGTLGTDAPGTFYVDQSFDGSNWDSTITQAVTAGNNSIDCNVFAPWVQLRYTNGASDQSYLRLFVRTVGTRSNR